jgi:hypothetical protein
MRETEAIVRTNIVRAGHRNFEESWHTTMRVAKLNPANSGMVASPTRSIHLRRSSLEILGTDLLSM